MIGGAGPVRGAASVSRSERARLLDLAHAGEGDDAPPRRRGRAARVGRARRPALLLRRRARAARQQQGPRPAAAGARGLRRRRRRARRCASPTAKLVDGEVERGDGGRRPRSTSGRARPAWSSGRGRTPCRSSSGSRSGSSSPSCRRPTAAAAARRRCSRRPSLGRSRGSSASTTIDGRRFRMNFGVEGIERARGGRVARPPRPGRRRGRHPAGPRRPLRDHDPEPRHGLHRPRHAEGARRATAATVETTEPLPFGIHAAVAEPGRVRRRRPGRARLAVSVRQPGRRPAVAAWPDRGFTGGGKWGTVVRSGPCCSVSTSMRWMRRTASHSRRSSEEPSGTASS